MQCEDFYVFGGSSSASLDFFVELQRQKRLLERNYVVQEARSLVARQAGARRHSGYYAYMHGGRVWSHHGNQRPTGYGRPYGVYGQQPSNWSISRGPRTKYTSYWNLRPSAPQRGMLQGAMPQRQHNMRAAGPARGGKKLVTPTRQQLDAELESYMSNSRATLDRQLDAYMGDADNSE